MDTLLTNGDYALDERGFPARVSGIEELAQQAVLRLTTKRGAFALDAALGSELYRLRGRDISAAAERCVAQALVPVAGLAVESISCEALGEGGARLDIRLSASGGETVVIPVRV